MATTAPRKIIIAMDGSKQSEYALSYYKENVEHKGDDVTIVFAAEHGNLTSQPVFSTDPQFLARMCSEEEGEIKKLVDKLEKMLTEAGVPGKVLRYSGNTPGEAVIKASQELGADLIITGTRGLGKIRRTLMGSVSQYIVHHAHVPVLVCREK
ncbi:universal stress protein in QAH/OAS sulfhydrylase 3'region-like [Littorina saxatilis]|uniref:UspA domain-containing protein n=1 Tax=Littorina saxatilis TaxID=31220 RepID=A0AAN9GAZ1_9CAEN